MSTSISARTISSSTVLRLGEARQLIAPRTTVRQSSRMLDRTNVGTTRAVRTQDGRNLTYLEVGDPHGPLVIHNHGGPSSRLEARLFADSASKNRLRLICVDRPGIGQSSPQKTRSYADWAEDVTTIADALGCHEFGVTGWSEGGPWALAAAAYIDPLRLLHVSSIAGGSYGTFGDNWAKDTFLRSTRWADFSHCILNLASA